ncbi:Tfp pilus assembly protein PilN [Curtobacterium sp. PhB130]|uniref:hypothetical protein n=1 Tax=unclassified Curtobacterium TaxID=257496 RepID=UPI000F4C739A|nr:MULTISPECIES: hypothetical protein [unclassified Curtobacterium]ROS77553.1 Tfp pilus assembly protein PilN [Curtobacterium sp. PhB130]TCK66240.1 Tfp pilus assembly protein PilN [Curtobacterium sp. PhB136]
MTEIIDAPSVDGATAPRKRLGRKSTPTEKATRETTKRPRRGTVPFVVGGTPRVDLLPSEVHVHRRQRASVRRAWAGVVVVALAVGIGAGSAALTRMSAEDDLTAAQAETSTLLQQQLQYKDVRTTERDSTLLEASQQVGGATEIDWSATLQSVQGKLPAGVQIVGVAIDSASATEAYAQSDDPLQGQRIATLTIDATSTTLPSVPDWLTALRGVTGFVDASANSVTRDDTSSGYTVNMTIHLDEKAYDDRYAAKKG